MSAPTLSAKQDKPKRVRRTRDQVAVIEQAVIDTCERRHPIGVRSVFYQLVNQELVGKTEHGSDQVEYYVLKLRRAGRLPYAYITDGTRWRIKTTSFDDLADAVGYWQQHFRRALWLDQDCHVEVLIEKEGLVGTVQPVTEEYDVALLPARGFGSETYIYETSEAIVAADKPTYLYLLGDLDGSGVAATNFFARRLTEFVAGRVPLTIERLGVTEEQVHRWRLPTRPGKENSHTPAYRGPCVELDAVPPDVLRALVREAIEQHIDPMALDATRMVEQVEREQLDLLQGYIKSGGKVTSLLRWKTEEAS